MTVKGRKASGLSEDSRQRKNASIRETKNKTGEKRAQQTCRVFTLKIRQNKLNQNQRESLKMLFVEAKWLRNAIIASNNIATYDESQHSVLVKNKTSEIENRNFNYLGSQMKQAVKTQILQDMRSLAARKKNGYRVGRLKFVSEIQSLNLKQYGNTYRFKSETKVKIQNVPGYVRVDGRRQLVGYDLANAKLLNKPDGYYLAVTAYKNKDEIKDFYQPGTVVGLDMGVKTHLTLSDGREFNVLVRETERLKLLQRKMVRQVKGSKNRHKTLQKIKIEYQKMDNRKDNEANKIVRSILENELVFMQNEQLASWKSKSGFVKAGKRLQHSVLGRVKAKLIKHERVTVLAQNSPTTKTCFCGKKNKLELSERVYSCVCGYSLARDLHASQNMIRLGKSLIPVEHRDFKLVERVSDWSSSEFQLRAAKQEASKSLVST